jgi:hypothetical protein
VLLRVFIGFATAPIAFLLTALFFARQQTILFRVALLQVDRAFVGAFLHRHHRRNVRPLANRILLGSDRHSAQGSIGGSI